MGVGGLNPVYIKISNKEIKQQPPSNFLKDKRLWQTPFQRHIDDKKMTSEGCESKPPASKVQWKGSKQAKERGRNSEGPDNLESCTTYWWKCTFVLVMESNAQILAGGGWELFYLYCRHTQLSLVHINRDLVPHRFLSAFLLPKSLWQT